MSNLADSYVANAARGRREVTELVAARKCEKYAAILLAYVSFNSDGNPLAQQMTRIAISYLGCRISDVSGDSREGSFVLQRMSVTFSVSM